MKARVSVIVIIAALWASLAAASDAYLIILDGNPQNAVGALSQFPGKYWGMNKERVYLYGGQREIDWLNHYHIQYRAVDYNLESQNIYISYIKPGTAITDDILDRGSDFVLGARPIPGALSVRRLTLKKLPRQFGEINTNPTSILTYDANVDSLISRVNQDTIISYLSRLTGETPIEINGGLDTIKTRFSGTEDNLLAAQWLKEILEGYGYQTTYHGFYSGTLRHVAAYDVNRAWTVTEGSEALRTTDGGITWLDMPDNTTAQLWGVENVGADSVWLSGNTGVVRFSSDGGVSFVNQTPGMNGFLFGIDFIDSQRGWIAADLGYVVRTTNGGQNWTRLNTSTSSRLYDICFADSVNGWAVGRDGVIIHTSDGGANWNTQTTNTNQRLYGVDFLDNNNGWVVGWGGMVLHTTNGGDNWEFVDLGNEIERYHVVFSSPLHGCIVGWNGEIYVTIDGGESWNEVVSGTGADFHGLAFCDDLNGFAVGNGIILKTTDGGQTWNNQTAGVESSSRNVIATKPGSVSPNQEVIICAHFDNTSEQAPIRASGADDNGSGSIGVIEAARIFQNVEFEQTIKFCLWTGEEQGLLGSEAYASDAVARGDSITGVYNYDMIAWDGNNDGSIELHCGNMTSSQDLGHIFEDVIADYGIGLVVEFLTWNSSDRSDHASFWDHDIPAILGIEDYSGDFNPYYHTNNDNMSIIDEEYFQDFVKAGIGAVATFSTIDSLYVSVEEGSVPLRFALGKNYPNPFNASTIISFNLPYRAETRLEVFDITGRRVATLIDENKEAGKHSITWNASGFASGIYLCSLNAGEYRAKGRMTLIK